MGLRRIWIDFRTYEAEGVILNLEDRALERVDLRQVGKELRKCLVIKIQPPTVKRPTHRGLKWA